VASLTPLVAATAVHRGWSPFPPTWVSISRPESDRRFDDL